VKNTPSALKWLAEKRGRLAHDLAATKSIADDVNRRLEVLRMDLEAVDRALTIFDPAIVPASIEAVNGWKGRYGARGALKATVEALLKAQGDQWTSTETLELLVRSELKLTFDTPAARKRWYDNSFTKQLRELTKAGLVEREHDAAVQSQEMGHWRWKREERRSLAKLRAPDISAPLEN